MALAPAIAEIAPLASPVVIAPNGFRVEGLDVAGVVTVLRGLA